VLLFGFGHSVEVTQSEVSVVQLKCGQGLFPARLREASPALENAQATMPHQKHPRLLGILRVDCSIAPSLEFKLANSRLEDGVLRPRSRMMGGDVTVAGEPARSSPCACRSVCQSAANSSQWRL
jgi:hypothetical protein